MHMHLDPGRIDWKLRKWELEAEPDGGVPNCCLQFLCMHACTTTSSSKRLFFSHNLTMPFSPLNYKWEAYHSRVTTCQTQGLNRESISGFSIAWVLNPKSTTNTEFQTGRFPERNWHSKGGEWASQPEWKQDKSASISCSLQSPSSCGNLTTLSKTAIPNSTPSSPHIAKQKVCYTIQQLWFICHFLFKALLLMACTSVVVAWKL